jgi:LuxR family maltose regulon positive regulatory protein
MLRASVIVRHRTGNEKNTGLQPRIQESMQTTQHSELSLIRTKLAPPKVGNAPVSRDALLRQLDERRDRKVALVVGPAGSGKTMLLTQWRRQLLLQGAVVAWFNASVDDDDPHVAAYLLESLRLAGLTIDTEALDLYIRSGGKAWKPLLASLINDLSDHDGEIYIVIDDLHHLTSFAMLQLIDRWIAMAPPNTHLVLGSRSRPPLDLMSLQARDQLTELRFSDLRFGIEETQRFIETQGLRQLTSAHVGSLHDITDGWAAGLQLLAFSLRKHKTPETFLEQREHLSLSKEAALGEFLERAATEHLSEAELNFLTQISACRRFNRELCEVLTGDPAAADYLRKFESENLFLIPIDTHDREPWYRFHRLFASFLNARLERRPIAEVRQRHGIVSRWFAAKNLHVEALRHATLADDTEFVIELIDRAARRMINGANFSQLLQWCDSVPYERLKSNLNVCLCAAWAQLSCSRVDAFDRTIGDIALHPHYQNLDGNSERNAEIRIEVELLKAYRAMRQDDTQTSLAIVEPMQAAPPHNPFHALLMCTIAGMSLVYANQFETAREVARWRHRYVTTARASSLADVVVGFSQLVQGDIDLAVTSLQPFVEHPHGATNLGADALGLFAGYLLEALYQSNQIQHARDLLERHWELIDVVGSADSLLMAHRVRARIEQLDGDMAGAQKTLQALEEIGYRKNLDRLIAWSLYEQLRLSKQSAIGSSQAELLRRLQQLAQRYADQDNTVRSEIPLAALLAKAEDAFVNAPGEDCLLAIDTADSAAKTNHRQLISTQLGLLRAIVLLQLDRRDEALALGRSLVQRASDAGMRRLLPDIGVRALPLIAALIEDGKFTADASAYLQAAKAALDGDLQAPGAATPAIGKATPLSARELDVLQLLAKALSTKSIARSLNLSPGTVKWHLKNIYGKFGAVSREDVLAKARMTGVIS